MTPKIAAMPTRVPNARASGGRLTAADRHALPKSDFGLPGQRKYPLPDANHARAALSRAAANATPSQQDEIRAKVHRKFPDISKD